jgi:DNA invertase Pin-like site-specific DNA recombinase
LTVDKCPTRRKDCIVVDAVAYVRTSRPDQNIRRQIDALSQRAAQSGFALREVLEDRGVSGAVPLADRPAGGKLAACVGEVRHIFISHCDRLWRSVVDAEGYLAAWPDQDIVLHLAEPAVEYSLQSVADRLRIRLAVAVAQYEHELISEGAAASHARRKAEGWYTGGRVQDGFRIRDGRFEPDPEQQDIIAAAKAMQAAGMSPAEIGRELGDVGVPLHPEKVRRMLKSEGHDGTK